MDDYPYFQLRQEIEDKTQKLVELLKELHHERLNNEEVIYKEIVEIKEKIDPIK